MVAQESCQGALRLFLASTLVFFSIHAKHLSATKIQVWKQILQSVNPWVYIGSMCLILEQVLMVYKKKRIKVQCSYENE